MEYDANQRAGLSLSTGEKKPEWGTLPRSPSDTVTCREGLADENPKCGSATRPQQALEDSRLCSFPSLICLQTFTEASPPGSLGKIARHTLPSSDLAHELRDQGEAPKLPHKEAGKAVHPTLWTLGPLKKILTLLIFKKIV